MHPFCAGLRDRLGLFFQLNNITHKPKLVGVTGFSKGAGTSTIATRPRCRTLRDRRRQGASCEHERKPRRRSPILRRSAHNEPRCRNQTSRASIPKLLKISTSRQPEPKQELWQAKASKRFHSLLPQFEASDYDYIIFDLPPLGQTSPTVAMAGLMDKVLLVVESEKSDPNAIKRGYAELIAAKANVSAVFNKEKSYLPKWLKGSDA